MKISLLFTLAIFLQPLCGQYTEDIPNRNESNIYFQTINNYLRFSEKVKKNIDTLFLEQNYAITDSILSECHHTRLIALNENEIKDLLKKGRSLNFYRLSPVRHKGDIYFVTLTPFGCGFNKIKNKYEFLYGGHYVAFFKLEGKKFVFEKLQEQGI
jgi:hypothetical protein